MPFYGVLNWFLIPLGLSACLKRYLRLCFQMMTELDSLFEEIFWWRLHCRYHVTAVVSLDFINLHIINLLQCRYFHVSISLGRHELLTKIFCILKDCTTQFKAGNQLFLACKVPQYLFCTSPTGCQSQKKNKRQWLRCLNMILKYSLAK